MCIAIGCYPQPLYDLLPFDMQALHWLPYDMAHVVTTLQLLLFSALAFVFLQKTGLYPPELRSINIDTEIVYRKWVPGLVSFLRQLLGGLADRLRAILQPRLGRLVDTVGHWHSPGGLLGEPWPIGVAALWAGILLFFFLVLSYL